MNRPLLVEREGRGCRVKTFTDDVGRQISLARPASRVVSLAPSATEILFAVGLTTEVVGVTTFCDYPPAAKAKPKIGSAIPNLEAIIGLKPDLVLAVKSEIIRPDILAKLNQLTIPLFILAAKTVEEILGHIVTVGRLVGREREARLVMGTLTERVRAIRRRMASVKPVRVFYVINSDPLMSIGSGSFIHQMLELAGGTNIIGRTTIPYPKVSLEEVLRRDPEVLLFPVGASEGIPEHEQQRWRKWSTLSAVKQNRLRQVKAELVNRPGPRVVDGIDAIAQALHERVGP